MKTITITVTDEEMDIFARARGYTDTIEQYNQELQQTEIVSRNIDDYTKNIVTQIIKNDSIRYVKRVAEEQARQSITDQVNAITSAEIDIQIVDIP